MTINKSQTALDLTEETRQSYQPLRPPTEFEQAELTKRWQRARTVAEQAANLLRSQFRAKRIALFGSVTNPALFTPWSDIDLAVWGIPALQFYRAVAVVSGLSAEFKIDLVDPEDCPPTLLQVIKKNGVDL